MIEQNNIPSFGRFIGLPRLGMFACVRLLLVVVVAFALSDFDIVIGDAIDDAVGVVGAAAPEAFVVALERFWFAETFEGMAVDVI